MAINTKLTRKFRKLVTKPDRFFADLMRKRAPVTAPAAVASQVAFDTTDYLITDGVVIITDPQVVDRLQALKNSKKFVKVHLSWKKP